MISSSSRRISDPAYLPNSTFIPGFTRKGTTLRLGVTVSPPVLPIYVRAAIPLHLEPSPFQSYFRLGGGTLPQ